MLNKRRERHNTYGHRKGTSIEFEEQEIFHGKLKLEAAHGWMDGWMDGTSTREFR